ncbi:M1 family aminopeptidase [Thermococcus alcaliphilus]|uniref:M1 family aminopeptidase n=1 Tax=Thermococcus alcaliphilus TaxID=139207 RepID=UPI002090C463|nr:M1 family aminopeptidase [Thermococcus alcaliphilus]MCO6040310.1 aminopeptidase [Thermococcus alcaliphilus]
MKFLKVRTFFVVLGIIMLFLLVLIIAESNSINESLNLDAKILSSQMEYSMLKTQTVSKYNYSNYNISVLFNFSIEKAVLGFKGTMIERISFRGLTSSKPIWIEVHIPDKIHFHPIYYSHIEPREIFCYKERCLLLFNPLSENGSLIFAYSFKLIDQNSNVPFNDPSYKFFGNEKVALPLGLTFIGINSAATSGEVSFLLFKAPWEDTKAFLLVNQTLTSLIVGKEKIVPTPQDNQFLLFAGRFGEIEGSAMNGTKIKIYYPSDEPFEISPQEVLNWSKKVISTYVSTYSILPSKEYYIINWNSGEANGNGFINGIIVGRWSARGRLIDRLNKRLIAHELAHSWFGGYANFGLLDEALATFSDLYVENKFGEDTYPFAENKALNSGKVPLAEITKNVPDYQNALYYKGAFVFRSLQFVLGNETFFNGLRELLRECHGKECNLTDVQNVFEKVSGQDLDWFFKEWFYSSKVPDYDVRSLSLEEKNGKYLLTFEVIDKNNFTMPLEVEVITSKEKLVKKVWIKGKARVSFELNDKPLKIILDPNEWMVNENKEYTTEGIKITVE